MKTQRGLTLTSVIIYVIVMLVIISVVSVLTSFFYKNVSVDQKTDVAMKQFTTFNSFFSEEINKKGNQVLEVNSKVEEVNGEQKAINDIVFSSNNVYTFVEKNKSIYRNQVKICEQVDYCSFAYKYEDGKYKITLEFKAGNFDRTSANAIVYTIQ